jgi:isopenicillin N synthase-like dioxygenase
MARNGSKAIELPLIDVTKTDGQTAKQLVDAVATHGFVYLKNNNGEIPPGEIDEVFDLV